MIPKSIITKKMVDIMRQRPLLHTDPHENINELLRRWNELWHFIVEYEQ
jgi:hypothetical protein